MIIFAERQNRNFEMDFRNLIFAKKFLQIFRSASWLVGWLDGS